MSSKFILWNSKFLLTPVWKFAVDSDCCCEEIAAPCITCSDVQSDATAGSVVGACDAYCATADDGDNAAGNYSYQGFTGTSSDCIWEYWGYASATDPACKWRMLLTYIKATEAWSAECICDGVDGYSKFSNSTITSVSCNSDTGTLTGSFDMAGENGTYANCSDCTLPMTL